MSGRPSELFSLFAGLETLSGIGPKTAKLFPQMGIEAPRDLLFTLPHTGVDRRLRGSIQEADLPGVVTVTVMIGAHRPPRNRGGAYRIQVEDEQTSFQLVYFHARGDYLERILPTGSQRVVSGRVEIFDSIAQMVHPDHAVTPEDAAAIPSFEPVYPLTAGVTQKVMFKATRGALERMPAMAEWIAPSQIAKSEWPDFVGAIRAAHTPTGQDELGVTSPARERLAYDELMAISLRLHWHGKKSATFRGRSAERRVSCKQKYWRHCLIAQRARNSGRFPKSLMIWRAVIG